VLSIGLGTGILVGEVARHPGVERVECVELSPSVIEGARLFTAYNDGALDQPAIHVVNDDGVNYLRRSQERYDAIISDGKSKSGHAGNGLFYSEDYYRSAREHLGPAGMMIQWVPLEVTPRDLRTIVRTFAGAFSHAYVWLGQDSAFLVGLARPLVLDLAHAQRVLDSPASEHLRRHGWRTASDVATLLLADSPALGAWLAQEDTINSFEHPVLEFYDPGAVELGEQARIAENLRALDRVAGPVLSTVTLTGADARELAATSRAVAGLIDGVAALGLGDRGGLNLLRRAIAAAPEHGLVQQWGATELFEAARELDLRGDLDHAVELYREALRTWPDFVEARVNLGRALALRGWTGEAIVEYRRAIQLDPESGSAHRALAEIFQAAGDTELALAHGREAARIAPAWAEVHDDLGLSLATVGKLNDALAEFREAMRLRPDWAVPMDRAALLLAMHPGATADEVREAVRLAGRAAKLTDWKDPAALETLAATYAAAGQFEDAIGTEQRALEVANAGGDGNLTAAMAATLNIYREHKMLPLLSGSGPPSRSP
jgi:spermidine synthase